MERGIKAFFYDYKYYLFPEDCQTLAELKDRSSVYTKRLKEEFCMAPDFVYESVVEEKVEIESPNRLFETDVNLYSREEYDEILAKQVRLRCPNCERYVPEEDENGKLSLDGHHREMSLSGACYEREDEEEHWSFSMCATYFWRRIAARRGELAACIDKNNQKKLNKILNGELTRFCPPVTFFGNKKEGKYALYLSSGGLRSSVYIMLISCLTFAANLEAGLKENGWEVFPFLPAGVKKIEIKENQFPLYLAPAENPNKLIVRIQHPRAEKMSDKEKGKTLAILDEYLCAELGEEVINSVTEEFEIVCDKENVIPMSEVKRKLQEKYEDSFVDESGEKAPYPPFCSYGRSEEDEEENVAAAWWLPYKNYVREGTSTAPEVTFLEREQLEGDKPWWMALASYVYIYVPVGLDSPENPYATLAWYLTNAERIPEPLRDPTDKKISATNVGIADCAEHGFILDQLVVDEKKFFRLLRTVAPVLRAYGAKAVVVNTEGVNVYACDYDFTPLEV